jgi:hypothetical protein
LRVDGRMKVARAGGRVEGWRGTSELGEQQHMRAPPTSAERRRDSLARRIGGLWPSTNFHRSIYRYHVEHQPWLDADLVLERIGLTTNDPSRPRACVCARSCGSGKRRTSGSRPRRHPSCAFWATRLPAEMATIRFCRAGFPAFSPCPAPRPLHDPGRSLFG